MIRSIWLCVSLVLPMLSYAAVEDTDSVPTTISMTEYCGITNVSSVDFVGLEASSAIPALVAYVDIDCPAGNYNLIVDGSNADGYFYIGPNARIKAYQTTYGWVTGTNGIDFPLTGGPMTLPVAIRVMDINSHTITPETAITWSGNLPLTLSSVP